jgi:hypothetical protein
MSFWERFRNGLHECRRTPAVALLALLLLAPLYAGKIPCKFTTNSRVVAVADIHGDFDNFKKILKGTGLIDDDLNWIGGDAHFVQLGDVLDRGDHGRKILDLLMRLEKQAEEAGGMVHVLIGNHEEANITGLVFDQAGYLTYGQLISFLPQDFVDRYNKTFRKKLGLTDGSDGKSDPRIVDLWTKEVAKAQGKPPGENETRDAYCKNFYMNYGKWLLTKNIVIKINENIFVHGGLSDNNTYLNKDLETLNNEARREFRAVAEWAARERVDLALPSQNYLMRPESPQWYRDWARDPEDGNSVTLDKILSNYRAKRMIIGHTVRDVEFIETRKLDRFDGKIWAIDVGISEFYNDIQCALEIRRERIPIILREYDVSRFEIYWGDDEKK